MFNKEERKLHLQAISGDVSSMRPMEWEQVFSVCPAIVSLKLSAKLIGTSAKAIGAAYGPTLLELTTPDPIDVLICQELLIQCPNLVQLSMSGDDGVSHAAILQVIASACSKLQNLLILGGWSSFPFQQIRREEAHMITDAHMEELLTGCVVLRVVTMSVPTKITKRTLEVILQRRMVFRTLTFHKDVGVTAADVLWFRDQTKELQLLPVLTIKIA